MNKRLICFIIIISVLMPNLTFANKSSAILDYANISQWHQLGYTGKGVTIVVDDITTNNHVDKVLDVIKQVAPDAKVITLTDVTLSYSVKIAIKENAQILNRSLYTEYWDFTDNDKHSKLAYDNNIFINGISGNNGDKPTLYLKSPYWFSTGAVELVNGKPKRTYYSGYGDGLDIVGFTNIHIDKYGRFEGTSASTPYVSGMVALYYQYFKEKNGRFPTVTESRNFIYENCMDLEKQGYDIYTGHGLFILPKLNIEDEIIPEKSNPLAVKTINSKKKIRYVHIDYIDKFIKNFGYSLVRW